MKSIPHTTYEDAARDYLDMFRALMQPAEKELAGSGTRGSVDLPGEVLIQRAREIAVVCSGMLQLAEAHLKSADPAIREGIRFQLIDQATIEMLLGIELIQISEEKAAAVPTAALRATHGAALREAMSAIERSSAVPVSQGLRVAESYRVSEAATIDEALSGLQLALAGAISNICHRVQELGADIAFDLVSAMQRPEVGQGVSLSDAEIKAMLESIPKGTTSELLLDVHSKLTALLIEDDSAVARQKIREWLDQIKQAGRIDIFNGLVESLYKADTLKKSLGTINRSDTLLGPVNRATDLIKGVSNRAIALIGRMRKLEDAIRLGKPIDNPLFRIMTAALQVALLSAVVYSGLDYIENGLAGILRDKGIL
jgi:hypothetical protein